MTTQANDKLGQHLKVGLPFLQSSSHSVKNCIGQHTGLIDQSTINSIVNHILQFSRVDFKSNLLRHQQFFLLDHFAAPIDTKGSQAKLLVLLHRFCHSLFLLIPEISLRQSNDVFCVELSMSHVDLDDRFVPPGVLKRCVDAKVDLKTQRANTRFNVKACQPI